MAADADLIRRSLDGDVDAFVRVVERHEAAVGSYLARRVGRDAAEDLVADVTNLAAGWDPWSAADLGLDARVVLRAALLRLKPEEREVLRLVAWEDLTAADAARTRGMAAGTARRLLSQAWTALRNAPEVSALLKDRNSAGPGTVRVLGPISMEDLPVETIPTMETTPVRDNGSLPAVRSRRKISVAGRLGVGGGLCVAAAAAVIALVVADAEPAGTTVAPVAKSPGAGTAGTADTTASPAGGQVPRGGHSWDG